MKTLTRSLFLLAVLLAPSLAHAQSTARPTDSFEWTIVASSLAQAQGYTYELELDSVVLTTPLVHTCSGAGPFLCRAPIPAVTPSSHTVRVRAADRSIIAQIVFGDWSDPLTFTMRAVPGKPGNLRIQPATPGGGDEADGDPHDLGEVPAPGAGQ